MSYSFFVHTVGLSTISLSISSIGEAYAIAACHVESSNIVGIV